MSFAKPVAEPKEKIFLGLASVIAHVRGDSKERAPDGGARVIGEDLHKQVDHINTLEKMLSKGGVLRSARTPIKPGGMSAGKTKKRKKVDKTASGAATQRTNVNSKLFTPIRASPTKGKKKKSKKSKKAAEHIIDEDNIAQDMMSNDYGQTNLDFPPSSNPEAHPMHAAYPSFSPDDPSAQLVIQDQQLPNEANQIPE